MKHNRETHYAEAHSGRIATMTGQVSRFWCVACLSLAAGAVWVSLAMAQQPVVPAPPPELNPDMLNVPVVPTDEVPGLRQFTRTSFDAGHVAWTMVGTIAAVFLLAPGLAFFYCGLANKSNVTALLVECLLLAALLSLAWVLWIYSLAFSRNENSFDIMERELLTTDEAKQQGNRFLGGVNHFALQGFDPQLKDTSSAYPLRHPGDAIPHLLFMAIQMGIFMTAAIPLAGVLAPRSFAGARMLFGLLWGTLVYAPIAYWVWGGGWHAAALDYAGGVVVHASVGFSALAFAFYLSRTPVSPGSPPAPEQPNLAALGIGTVLYWGGSLLCNASHALAANAQSINACVTTHLAACTGVLGWTGCEWLARGKVSLTGICAGAMAGLIAIAPACGFVAPQSALLIGLAAGIACQLCYRFCALRWPANSFLAPFALQGAGGALGVLLTGVFATGGIAGFNRRGDEIHGLLSGNSDQLLLQATALASAAALALVGTLLIAGVVRLVARPVAPGTNSSSST